MKRFSIFLLVVFILAFVFLRKKSAVVEEFTDSENPVKNLAITIMPQTNFSPKNKPLPNNSAAISEENKKFLQEFRNEAAQIGIGLVANPEKTAEKLQVLASNLNSEQIDYLYSTLKNQKKNYEDRLLAADLLQRSQVAQKQLIQSLDYLEVSAWQKKHSGPEQAGNQEAALAMFIIHALLQSTALDSSVVFLEELKHKENLSPLKKYLSRLHSAAVQNKLPEFFKAQERAISQLVK